MKRIVRMGEQAFVLFQGQVEVQLSVSEMKNSLLE